MSAQRPFRRLADRNEGGCTVVGVGAGVAERATIILRQMALASPSVGARSSGCAAHLPDTRSSGRRPSPVKEPRAPRSEVLRRRGMAASN